MHALRARDDLFAADEHVERVAVARILRVRHRVERPHLHTRREPNARRQKTKYSCLELCLYSSQ